MRACNTHQSPRIEVDTMKTALFGVFIFLFLFLNYSFASAIQSNGPKIQIQPDSLFFETPYSHDTLLVVNTGDLDLVIDNIEAARPYGYDIEVVTNDSTFNVNIFEFENNKLVLSAEDSALLIFFPPDLCPICSSSPTLKPFKDTLFVFNNDSVNNPVTIPVSGEAQASPVEEQNTSVPNAYVLHQNHPNPFNPSTQIVFALPVRADVTLVIHNSLGQVVRSLKHREFEAGEHQVSWNGRDDSNRKVASGVYFLRMIVSQGSRKTQHKQSIKMTLLQ